MLKGMAVDKASLTDAAREYAFPDMGDDLRATNSRLGPLLEDRWPFDPERLMASAREQTGLADFGPEYFRPALDMICKSAREDLDLNPVGHRNLWFQIHDHLVQRLRFVDLWTRHPEILDERIEKPIFIVGLPRSGTTFIHQLLAQDDQMRVVPFWEQIGPLPDHDPAIRPPDDEPMKDRARKNVEGLKTHAPGLLEMHQLAWDMPEEEIYLLGPAFASMAYEWVYIMPQYAAFYAAQDHTEGYRFFRQILQALQWIRGGGRWLLKAPQHMEQIGPLLTVFPDALYVETLRDPVTAATSNASLSCYGQRIRTDRPNPHAAGQSCMVIIDRLVNNLLRDQPDNDPRFVELQFRDLMAEPLDAVRKVYAALGEEPSDSALAAMREYIRHNNEGHSGGRKYDPVDFGIDVPALRKAVAGYYKRFGVEPDPRFG